MKRPRDSPRKNQQLDLPPNPILVTDFDVMVYSLDLDDVDPWGAPQRAAKMVSIKDL